MEFLGRWREGRSGDPEGQWRHQQEWPLEQGGEDWERCKQGQGRADRLSDGRILLREELEKRIGGKFVDRYLENQAKGK